MDTPVGITPPSGRPSSEARQALLERSIATYSTQNVLELNCDNVIGPPAAKLPKYKTPQKSQNAKVP